MEERSRIVRSRIAVVISWMVIWGTVGLIAGLPYLVKKETGVEPPNLQLKFVGRYVMGLKSLSPQMFAAGNSGSQFEKMVREAAVLPVDRLRVIPVLVELEGGVAAGKLLDEIEKSGAPPEVLGDAKLLRIIYEKGPGALDEGQKKGLVERHGWFAELALSFGEGKDSAARRAAVLPAQRVIFGAVAMFIVGGIAFLVGLVLLIWFLVKLVSGRKPVMRVEWGTATPYSYVQTVPDPMRMQYEPDPGAPTAFLEAFAVYLGGFLAASLLVMALIPKAGLIIKVGVLAVPVAVAIVWPRLRGMAWGDVRKGLGLHRGRGFAREVVSGLAGYVAGLPLMGVAMIVTLILTKFGGKAPSHPLMNEISADFWSVVKLYLLASVWAPITEEILFRGALFHHMRRRHRWIVSGLIVSFIFAAIHPQGYLGIPMLMTIAMIFAGLREWRGSIIAPVVGHALNNFVATTVLILMLG